LHSFPTRRSSDLCFTKQRIDEGALTRGELPHDRDGERTSKALSSSDDLPHREGDLVERYSQDAIWNRGEHRGCGIEDVFEAAALHAHGQAAERGVSRPQ